MTFRIIAGRPVREPLDDYALDAHLSDQDREAVGRQGLGMILCVLAFLAVSVGLAVLLREWLT